MQITFLPYTYRIVCLFMCWYGQLSLKVLFRDILRMICHIDFKYGSFNFHQQRKQPAKYQHLSIAPLNNKKKYTVNLFLINFNTSKNIG